MIPEKTVMLLDKDQALCRALEKYLARYGYDVISSEPEQPAFTRISKYTPAIVVSGIDLPEITGVELLRKIKQSFPAIQMVMMVEDQELEAALECLRLGASDYLSKPINSEELAVVLERACARQALWHENVRFKAELEIARRNKALFQQLFDEVPCYISLQDANFRLTGANRRFKKDLQKLSRTTACKWNTENRGN